MLSLSDTSGKSTPNPGSLNAILEFWLGKDSLMQTIVREEKKKHETDLYRFIHTEIFPQHQ